MPIGRSGSESRWHSRRGRRDHLLRPLSREPGSHRRQNLGGKRGDGRAELRRSAHRGGAGNRRARDPRSDAGAAAPDHHPLRRWRTGVRHCAWHARTRRSSSSSRKAGTTCAARSSLARSCRSAADAPHTLCDALQTPRVSPITFGILRERRREGPYGQRRRRCVKRSDGPGTSISWSWSRVAQLRSRRCCRARPNLPRGLSSFCRVETSIRRFMREIVRGGA